MLICLILFTVLLLILPAISQHVKTTCKIPSVEAGDDTTLTTYFDINFTNEESTDFYVSHFGHNATESQVILRCIFSNGDVECDKTTCCTWERHVTDVFRVYIHNVSQEHEGRFWGFVSPADVREQKYCNFTLKASTCPTHVINASNSHLTCNNQSMTIGQTCTVTCSPGHYFQENQTSVTYTCVGKNKWSPEISVTSCEVYSQAQGQSANTYFLFLLIVIPVVIVTVILFKKRHTQKKQKERNASIEEENKAQSNPLICDVEIEMNRFREEKSAPSDLLISAVERETIPFVEEKSAPSDPLINTVERETIPFVGQLLPIRPNPIHPSQTAPQEDDKKNCLECIKKWYPELQSRTYFLPPFHFNRIEYCQQNVAGYQVSVLVPVPQIQEDSDACDDRALESVLQCLHKLADNPQLTDNSQQAENPHHTDNPQQRDSPQEVMMVISQLRFGKCIAAASNFAQQPNPSSEQRHPQQYDKGGSDILIIHKSLGLLTLQISNVGGNFSEKKMKKKRSDDLVMKGVEQAIKELNKAEDILKHLTRDITHITKILVLPNISSNQLRRVLKRNRSNKKFERENFGTKRIVDVMKFCLLKDQLSDNQTPSDINHSCLQAFREWWQHVRASRSGSSLTSSQYEELVARFCGPATKVEVHFVTAPHLNIRTLGEAVSETGEKVTRLVLFSQQVDILNQSPPRAFLSGPPGTGKTIVLIRQGLAWIQRGYDVHVVSTWYESRAVTIVIEYQLQETAKTLTAKSQETAKTSTGTSRVHRHQFDLRKDGEVKNAVSCLKSRSEERHLCVIADEAVRDDRKPFTEFCEELIKEVPRVYIWGASVHYDVRPLCLDEVKLTIPLRSPPVVVREVMEAKEIKDKKVDEYTVSGVPVPTDGPPVKRIKHRDDQSGHTGLWPYNCEACGHQVARVLTELDVGQIGNGNGPPPLQYRDVLVLCFNYPTDDQRKSNGQVHTTASGLVRGLRARHMPVRVVEKGDEVAIRDMALNVSDRVTVASWNDVHGLERKVVVVENEIEFVRLYSMSRSTSQLVLLEC